MLCTLLHVGVSLWIPAWIHLNIMGKEVNACAGSLPGIKKCLAQGPCMCPSISAQAEGRCGLVSAQEGGFRLWQGSSACCSVSRSFPRACPTRVSGLGSVWLAVNRGHSSVGTDPAVLPPGWTEGLLARGYNWELKPSLQNSPWSPKMEKVSFGRWSWGNIFCSCF